MGPHWQCGVAPLSLSPIEARVPLALEKDGWKGTDVNVRLHHDTRRRKSKGKRCISVDELIRSNKRSKKCSAALV
jgi:hypothetical protein